MSESQLLTEAIRGLRGDIRHLSDRLDRLSDDQGNLRVTVARMEGAAEGESRRGEKQHRFRTLFVNAAATFAVVVSAGNALKLF